MKIFQDLLVVSAVEECYLKESLLDETVHSYSYITPRNLQMQYHGFGIWSFEIHYKKMVVAQLLQRTQQIDVHSELFRCQTWHVLVFEFYLPIESLSMSKTIESHKL